MNCEYHLYKNVWCCNNTDEEALLSKQQCKDLLHRGGAMVRNVYDFDCGEETSFWFVIKDRFGGLEELSSGARRDVRKSLRTYDIGRISIDVLQTEGYAIYAGAQAAYRVHCDAFSKEEYDSLITKWRNDSKKEFWGVRHKESKELIAIAINSVWANRCEYNVLKCNPKALRDGTQPYYGLIYEMNRYYLEECGLKFVNDGARTLTEHSNIQPFLIQKFKFRKAYSRLSVTYQWWLLPIVKLLYPFRRLIRVNKIRAVLNIEAMARGEI